MVDVVTPAQLESKIRREIGAALVEAVDLSDGCGSKFSLVVVHEGFEGGHKGRRDESASCRVHADECVVQANRCCSASAR
jgi:stress-induced morphogen